MTAGAATILPLDHQNHLSWDRTSGDTGGEFGIAGLLWQHSVQSPSSDSSMLTAGRLILAAHRNSPPVSLLALPQYLTLANRAEEKQTAYQEYSRTNSTLITADIKTKV